MFKNLTLLALVCLSVFAFTSCKDDPEEAVPAVFTISTPAWNNGDTIPEKYSCDGEDVSPILEWTNAPDSTKSFVVIVDDPSAEELVGYNWVHGLMVNIKPSTMSLPEGVTATHISNLGGLMLPNSWRRFAYEGPCPPAGRVHNYAFRIYAIDVGNLEGINASSSRNDVDAAMEGHILAKANFRGFFTH